ncbi:MAG: HigA family addiction module antidote protein [Gammaproteobacteria bacterium]|nr:HigA family addiction module antidote protein [Gammaproteobacteria bacterium]
MMIHKPVHPGVILRDVLIDSTDLTISEAAERLGVTRTTLSRLLNQHAGISPEMALRLSKLLSTSIDMWVNFQSQYDIWHIKMHCGSEINIIPLDKAA